MGGVPASSSRRRTRPVPRRADRSAPVQPPSSGPSSNALALLAIVLATTLHALALTQGTLDFAVEDTQLTHFYDDLGTSLLHGRFDVPPDAIGVEAFVLHGRHYGYFGPTPALVRIPLNALVPGMRGRWARLTMTAACFFTLLAALHLLRNLTAWLPRDALQRWREGPWEVAGLMLALGLGTTLFFIAHRPIVYHEAMAFGVALALWAYLGAVAYFRTGHLRWLLTLVLCAFFATLSRASVGIGALLTAGVTTLVLAGRLAGITPEAVAPRVPQADLARHVAVGALVLTVCLGCMAYRNWQMFDSVTGNPPIRYHLAMQIDPVRMARLRGSYVQPQNLGTGLWNYLRPDGVTLQDAFPWLAPRPAEDLHQTHGTRIIWVEPFVSLPATSPLWCLLAAAGVWVAARRAALGSDTGRFVVRLVLLGTLLGGAPVLVWASISHRFLHDWLPFLVVAGLLGYTGLRAALVPVRWTPYLGGALMVLGLYSCYACVSTALVQPIGMGIGETPPDAP